MKRISIFLMLSLLLFVNACTSNVGVESAQHPVAEYDSFDGNFKGKMDGNLMSVFNAANKALDQLQYYRVGEKIGETSAYTVARAKLDAEIKVRVSQDKEKVGVCIVEVKYGGGSLIKAQEIFNTMARIMRHG